MLHLSENTTAALSELEQKDMFVINTPGGNNMKNKVIKISLIEVDNVLAGIF